MKRYLKKHRALFLGVIVLQLASAALLILGTVFNQRLVDTLLGGDMQAVWQAVMALLAFSAVSIAVLVAAQVGEARYTTRIVGDIRAQVFGGILQKGAGQYAKIDPALSLSVLTNDIATIKRRFFGMLFSIIMCSVGVVVSSAIMLAYHPLVALAAVVTSILMITVPMLAGKRMAKLEAQKSDRFAAYTGKLKDMLEGFEVIASFGVSRIMLRRFEQENQALVHAENSADQFEAATNIIAQGFSVLSSILMLVLSGLLVANGQMTVGTLTTFISLKTTFSSNLTYLLQLIPIIRGLGPVVERMNGLAFSEPAQNGAITPAFEKEIRLQDVGYAYLPDQFVLRGASCAFEKSGKYAVIGKNGSGKTTLLRLLCGYFHSYEGGIFFDGVEMKDLDRERLHRLVAVIHQQVFLFNDTIENNITLGEEFPAEKMERALLISGVADFAGLYEDGLAHPVGEAGSLLSGGQRQRIAIARAILRDTPLIILDEGTSAVDEQTSREIEDRLFQVPGLTLISVIHHAAPEHLHRFDRVLVLENGSIAPWESGSLE